MTDLKDWEKTVAKTDELFDRILDTPGLLEHKIRDGVLYLRFEHGIIDMTVPLVRNLLTSRGESWETIGNDSESCWDT
jgi:hypothetical protein